MADSYGENDPSASHFVRWVYETYRDQLRLPEIEGSRKFHDFIESSGVETILLSGAVRIQSFHIIKFGYPMRRAGYITAVITARMPNPKGEPFETYFAYVYWPKDFSQKDPTPEYICLSPTFESRDGEYRHRFLWVQQFLEGYEGLTDALSPVEQILLETVSEGDLEIDFQFFSADEQTDLLVSCAESIRLGIKALVAVLAVDGPRAHNKLLQNHSSPNYATIIERLYDKCAKVFGSWATTPIAAELSVFETGMARQPLRAQCGQKLIPLTVREVLQAEDINFAPWREIWASQQATDLVVNGVAPMFPIFNNWTYLGGVDQNLFENPVMRGRYRRSFQAEAVSESLRKARETMRESSENDYRMSQLDAHIYEAFVYAQDYILLTDAALCATSEFVGDTVRSVSDYARIRKTTHSPYVRMYDNPALQARYLFDLCYGAHALHTRVGAVHADLHLNNMTIFTPEDQYETREVGGKIITTERFRNPVIAYVAGERGEADTYVFPHDGWYACLIDFSRAILGPTARQKIIAEFGEPFAVKFYRDQVSRALRVLYHYIPDFTKKNQEPLKGLLLANPDAVFRAMTAIDFLAIGRNYGTLLKELARGERREQDRRVLEVAPEGIALAARIEQIGLEFLVTNLTQLISEKGKVPEIPWAGGVVFAGAFAAWRYGAWAEGEPEPKESKSPHSSGGAASSPKKTKPASKLPERPFPLRDVTLTDVYNIGAPLEYSGSDYDRFPPWARLDVLERHIKDIADVTSDRGERPFLRSLDLDGYLSVLQERVRQKVTDEPGAATSSWIAE